MPTSPESARSSRVRPCDLCGCDDFETLSERDRRRQPLVTVICRRCGLVSHERIPTHAELAEYYRDAYRLSYHDEYTPSARRVVREWERGALLVDRLAPGLRTGDEILEIGSGIGCTLKQLEAAGYTAWGIEPGNGFRTYSQKKLHARVRPGELEDLPATPVCDVVLLIHVLEHLPSPTGALQHIRALLRTGGRLYAEVPNLAAPHAAPGKAFHFAHIYNFTRMTLASLAAKCGYRIEWLTDEHHRNLGAWLHLDDIMPATVADPAGYLHARESLERYNVLTYHLRPAYLWDRASTIWHHQRQRLTARRAVAEIESRCAEIQPTKLKRSA